jgi:hypothetical protein
MTRRERYLKSAERALAKAISDTPATPPVEGRHTPLCAHCDLPMVGVSPDGEPLCRNHGGEPEPRWGYDSLDFQPWEGENDQ